MTATRLALAAAVLGSAACSTLRPVDPEQYIAAQRPDLVYVTNKNRTQVIVAKPRVSGDSLYGTWHQVGKQLAVPLEAIERVEVMQRDRGRTTLAIAGLTVATVAGVYAIVQVASGSEVCDYSGVTSHTCPGQ